jgi:hypothetical protein
LATGLRIETLDRSGRWYLTPGSRSIYDLRVRNEAKDPADCSIVIEDPTSGVTVDPPSFKLRGNEVRTVTVLFAENAQPRSQRVLMKLRDDSGAELAIFEQPVLVAGLTDCNIALSFKDAIVESGDVKGFLLACTLRSQSEGPATFALGLSSHPALAAADLPAVTLAPGESAEVVFPVRWDCSVKDAAGLNHPVTVEVSVPVSNGKRTARLRWDSFAAKLEPPKREKPVPSEMQAKPDMPKLLPKPAPTRLNGPPSDAPIAPPQTAAFADRVPDAPARREPIELSLFSITDLAAQTPPSTNGAAALVEPPAPPSAAQPPSTQAPEGMAPAQTEGTAASSPPVSADASGASARADSSGASTGAASSGASVVVPAAAKLTPYTPARFDALADSVVSPPPKSVTVIKARPTAIETRKVRFPIGVVAGAIAVAGTVAFAAILFRPNGSTKPATPPTAVAVASAAPASVAAPATRAVVHISMRAVKSKAAAAKPAARATIVPTPAPTPAAQTPPLATPRPATPRPAAATGVLRRRAPFHRAPLPRPQPAQQLSQSVVALGGIEAYYGPRGHAVRVLWSAADQAAASVQLINARGAVVSQTMVRGGRQNALLYLPRRFRGPLTIVVSSQGRLGERVAQTTSLPAFGY